MEIITTYFSNLRNIPDEFVPVSIARSQPNGMFLEECSELKPTARLLADWKQELITWPEYEETYKHEALYNISPVEFIDILSKRYGEKVALVCWEGKGKHCHRHIISSWLSTAASCREL